MLQGIKSTEKFFYKNNPLDNLKASIDIVKNPNAVYGFSPNPNSNSLKIFIKTDWSDVNQVKIATDRRILYHIKNDNIIELVQKMKNEGFSTKEIGISACNQRNYNRIEDYINDPVGLKNLMDRNIEVYKSPSGPTPLDSFEKYGSWKKVIEKSMGANPGMDACTGLYDKYFNNYK